MTCHKCGGLLVAERLLDFYCPSARWKCVNCGWVHPEHQQAQRPLARLLHDGSPRNRGVASQDAGTNSRGSRLNLRSVWRTP